MSLSRDGTVLSFNSSIYGNLTSLNNTVAFDFYPTRLNGYEVPITCVFPISGQYNFLPRILYYVLLVLCLVLRKQLWIVSGAMAIVLTYGASAAVHSIALFARFRLAQYTEKEIEEYVPFSPARSPADVGDIDFYATWLVVTSACIMLTPLLLWSTNAHRPRVRPLFWCWGVLMYAALLFSIVPMFRGVSPYFIRAQATCQAVPGQAKCSSASLDKDDFTMTRQWWTDCQCKDKCVLIDAEAPYRSSNSLTPLFDVSDHSPLFSSAFGYFDIFNQVSMFSILGRGVLALLDGRWSQRRVRASIFRRISGRAGVVERQPSLMHRLRRESARWMAASYYLLSGASAFGCPAFFVINIVVLEIFLVTWPEAEPKTAIDQWGPWIGLALVTLAAVIKRCHKPVALLVRSVTRKTVAGLRGARPGSEAAEAAEAAHKRSRRRVSWSHIGSLLLQPTRSLWRRFQEECRDFFAFVGDPVAHSAAVVTDRVERAMPPDGDGDDDDDDLEDTRPGSGRGDVVEARHSTPPLMTFLVEGGSDGGDGNCGSSGGGGSSSSGGIHPSPTQTSRVSTASLFTWLPGHIQPISSWADNTLAALRFSGSLAAREPELERIGFLQDEQ
ncbi:MAG: hypothetical protein M1826_001341 [Phylliscum demangeonii]|nr:MAG: hypothetical protein M1826_001341 [Phylliscum demangeonii]